MCHLLRGILPVCKPKGKTSFYVIKRIRHLFQEKKVGHCGTLDPFATGVLIVLIGKAYTTQSNQFLNQDKKYIARLFLGKSTDTYDLEGKVQAESAYVPSLEEIQKALLKFQGTIEQIPPMFSAKKINGKKLYELARSGKYIERKPCLVQINVELISYSYPHLDLKVSCSKGTYIRSLAHDLGLKLNTYAHLIELTRTRSGDFDLNQCLDLEKINSSNQAQLTVHKTGVFQIPSLLLQKE